MAFAAFQRANTWFIGPDERGRPGHGWTTFLGSPDTVIIYCSSSIGVDSNNGLHPDNSLGGINGPVATPAHAQTLLRNKFPDWLLFKKGDTFFGGIGGTTAGASLLDKSGRSRAEPMLISSYGTGARPLFKPNGVDTGFISAQNTRCAYIAIKGLECYNDFMDPANVIAQKADISTASPIVTNMASTVGIVAGQKVYGSGVFALVVVSTTSTSVTLSGNPSLTATQVLLQFCNNGSGSFTFLGGSAKTNEAIGFILIEDCKTTYMGLGLQNVSPEWLNQGTSQVANVDFRVRRNVILGAYSLTGGLGIFLAPNYQVPGLPINDAQVLFEGNVIDGSGWNPNVWAACGNIFSHNAYLHDPNPPISFLENISANASSSGGQVRNGGTILNNLSIANPTAFSINPAVNNNASSMNYNVLVNASDIIIGYRVATANEAIGSTTISFDGVISAGNGNVTSSLIANLDNPGSIPTVAGVGSLTATSVTIGSAGTVQAGIRGDGVKTGDRLVLFANRGWGVTVGVSGSFQPYWNPNSVGASFGANGTATITIASPGVFTDSTVSTNLDIRPNAPLSFTTTGALPTPLVVGQVYFIDSNYLGGSTYGIAAYPGGPLLALSGSQSGVHTRILYAYNDSYPGSLAVTMTIASPAVIADTFQLASGTPISFSTTGTLPTDAATGLPLSGTYYVANATAAGGHYNISSTLGGPLITTTGSQSGVHTRLGASTFLFPYNLPLPSWVTVGMSVVNLTNGATVAPYFSGSAGNTTIASISSDRLTMTTTDHLTTNIFCDFHDVMVIYTPGDASNFGTTTFGPYNIHANDTTRGSTGAPQGLVLTGGAQNVNAAGNYYYNWCPTFGNNIQDLGAVPGGVANVMTPTMNLAGSTAHLNASIEAYDASLQNNVFTATFSGATTLTAGYSGATMTMNSGTDPAIGDSLFGVTGGQYTTVISKTGTSPDTFLVATKGSQIVNAGPLTLTSGSAAHFLAQAALQSQDNWNPAYTANAANNFIRNALDPSIPPQ